MTERGIGEYGFVNGYIGLHYEIGGRDKHGIDCYGLVCLIYKEVLGIDLPDWVTDEFVDWDGEYGQWADIKDPVDFCLVRSTLGVNMPDHFGVYVAGGVISTGAPCSYFVPFDRYIAQHPDYSLGVFELNEDLVS